MTQPIDHARRRARLAERIGDRAVAMLAATPERTRNRDVHYPYRADSDMRYLTGFTEPEAVAVLAPGRPAGEFILFCRDRDPDREVWDGRRAGPEGACRDFGADQAFPIQELAQRLPELLADRATVHHSLGADDWADRQLTAALDRIRAMGRRGWQAPTQIGLLPAVLHDMRLRKEPAELDRMRHAAAVSAAAHCRAMRVCRSGMAEYALAAELHHEFEAAGMHWAYPSIVGGGANACILHYIENSATLADGDLVLIDAGAENAGYAADITRTFPINGRFSGPQRDLYAVVLAAQEAAVDAVRAGNDYDAFNRAAVRELCRGMLDLGLLTGDLETVIEQQDYKRFYMHGTGHWLGMDVHDVGDYKVEGKWRLLEPDMVVTVEPGLYVPAGSEGVDERFWNTGIRIEDDVRVTDGAPEVLTAGVPKRADEIEALMADG